MIRTVDELKQQAVKIGKSYWSFHSCSICKVPVGYEWVLSDLDDLIYDSSCDCVNWINRQPRTWDNLARSYNQENPKSFERNEREWGFISEGVNSETNSTR